MMRLFFSRWMGGLIRSGWVILAWATGLHAATFPVLTGVTRASSSVLVGGSPALIQCAYTTGTDPVVTVQISLTSTRGNPVLSATAVNSGATLSFETTSLAEADYALNSVTLVDRAGRRAIYARDKSLFNITVVSGETSAPEGTHALNFAPVDFHVGGFVSSPPTALIGPAPLTVAAGGTANFGTLFSGTPPITYQWSKNGTPIPGATNTALTMKYVQPGDAGSYSISATNTAGVAIAAPANLVVTTSPQAPSFIRPPVDVTTGDGGKISVSVQISSPNFAVVSWLALMKGRALEPVSTTSTAEGNAITATLGFGPVTPDDAGAFQLMATNAAGSSFSAARTLTVLPVPVISTQPLAQAVTAGGRVALSVVASGSGALTYQWSKGATAIAGATSATLELSSFKADDAGSYTVAVSDQNGTRVSNPAELTLATPSVVAIVTPPISQTVAVGSSVTFSVVASGTGPITYQWLKDARSINGATAATLTLSAVGALESGAYSVTVTNALGAVTSGAATLVITGAAPVIVTPPVGRTAPVGVDVSLAVVAVGSGSLTYQWFRNSTALTGATSATLVLNRAQPAVAGNYVVRVTNDTGSVTSAPARIDFADPSRLVNLSLLTPLAAGEAFTLGFVIGGEGTVGTKPLLVRAIGPTLGGFGVAGAHSDPRLQLFNAASVQVDENNDWGGAAARAELFAQVGAFALSSPASKDAALFAPALVAGGNSVRVSGVGDAAGTVLAELYETTPAAAVTTATPRLINVSVLKKLDAGLVAGFVVGGTGSRTLLVRAVGPALETLFGISGAVTDPSMVLSDAGGAVVQSNDNWLASDAAVMRGVGAFDLLPGSRDAALVAALPPGNYTIQVRGSGTNPTGSVLVEIYEVP